MQLLFGCDAEVARWVAARLPEFSEGDAVERPCAAIGVMRDDGSMVAGWAFHDYQPSAGTIQLSAAADAPTWARREVIAGLLAYPFRQLGVFKVWAAIGLWNERALSAAKSIGFKQEAVLAHQFGRKRHAAILRMLEPDFKRKYEAPDG